MFQIGKNCLIHPSAKINVQKGYIGSGAIIKENCVIEGYHIEIGRELFMNRGGWIGGGSSKDPLGYLSAGDFLHMGWNSHINIARSVTIGHEFGCGIESKIFTHGAYLPAVEGFPVKFDKVTIGNRVWMPNAWVNPGVDVGNDVVVAAGSVVNTSLPSGCLAGGIPAKVIKNGLYPKVLNSTERKNLIDLIISDCREIEDNFGAVEIDSQGWEIKIKDACFQLEKRAIYGSVSDSSEILRNQLRRYGIRFRYSPQKNKYAKWSNDVLS